MQEFALCFSDLEHVLKSIELEEYGGKEGDNHKAKTYFNIVLHILLKWKLYFMILSFHNHINSSGLANCLKKF